jgi:hypothetical protein
MPLQLAIPPQGHRVESRRRLSGAPAAERQAVSQTPATIMSTTSRTLTLVIFLGLATVSCRRADPIGSQPRVVRNLQSLVTLAVEMRRSDWKGRFTGKESPIPPGEPWRKPVKYDFPTYANLISGEDGLFHEQYEITVDPTG